MKWFIECATTDEVKNLYRKLAMEHHPDRGGDTRTMQEINAEYAFVIAKMVRQEKPGKTEAEYADMEDLAEALRRKINEILNLAGIEIEVCGTWIWVGGDTKPVKEELSAAGFKFAHKKVKWFYAGVPSNGRGRWSMGEIRERYGSQRVKSDDDDKSKRKAPALHYA